MEKINLVIQKLKEFRDKIPEIKEKEVTYHTTAEFDAWRAKGIKWLKLGLPFTKDELVAFERLYFAVRRVREGPYDYDQEDQQEYEEDCDRAADLINSAVENIEMGLIPEAAGQVEPPRRGRGSARYGEVSIAQAGTVIMGDENVVSIVDSITISDFLNALEKEIEAKVADPDEKKGLLQKIKAISENPITNTVIGQTVGAVIRGYFGG